MAGSTRFDLNISMDQSLKKVLTGGNQNIQTTINTIQDTITRALRGSSSYGGMETPRQMAMGSIMADSAARVRRMYGQKLREDIYGDMPMAGPYRYSSKLATSGEATFSGSKSHGISKPGEDPEARMQRITSAMEKFADGFKGAAIGAAAAYGGMTLGVGAKTASLAASHGLATSAAARSMAVGAGLSFGGSPGGLMNLMGAETSQGGVAAITQTLQHMRLQNIRPPENIINAAYAYAQNSGDVQGAIQMLSQNPGLLPIMAGRYKGASSPAMDFMKAQSQLATYFDQQNMTPERMKKALRYDVRQRLTEQYKTERFTMDGDAWWNPATFVGRLVPPEWRAAWNEGSSGLVEQAQRGTLVPAPAPMKTGSSPLSLPPLPAVGWDVTSGGGRGIVSAVTRFANEVSSVYAPGGAPQPVRAGR